jgi:para-aminobenzoate synthetase component 1
LHTQLDIPVERLAPLIGSWSDPALLTSGPGFRSAGRFSIYAARPRLAFEATGRAWRLVTPHSEESSNGDVLRPLEQLLRQFRLAQPDDIPEPEAAPFQGGLIGFFGYDLAPCLERLPRNAERDSRIPDVRFALYDTFVTHDHQNGIVALWAHDLLGEGRRATAARFDRWRRDLERDRPQSQARSRLGPVVSNFGRDDYLAAVERAQDYIRAGDVFQVNLSQRFQAGGQPVPLDLCLRLQKRSPAPFAAFLRWADLAVVSASPELFYETRAGSIVTRPIKGTRPRGEDSHADARLAAELRASPKDRAELVMIVDLERNDLGRVCEYGTVRVAEAAAIESFAQVHHLVATVEGQLRADIGPIDVLRSVFPGGSITGAPKIRAMEIIDELEPSRRSLYTGAIGYFSRGGTSAFNIAIRTLLVESDRARFQVGGGIVADSDPEAEYQETLDKGRGLLQVLATSEEAP